MSEENVEVVRRGFEAFSPNDFEGWYAVTSTKVKLYPRREEPGVKDSYEGWDGVLDYLVNWYAGWDEYTSEPVRFIDGGEYVIVDVREVGVAEQSGMRVEENFAPRVQGQRSQDRGMAHVRTGSGGAGRARALGVGRPRSSAVAASTTWRDSPGWRGAESNCRHHDFQSCALPTELPRRGRKG